MLKYIITLLSVFASFYLQGQSIVTKDSSVQLATYWSKNDSFKVKISYLSEETSNGGTERSKSELFADVKVIDSTSDSYTIEWKYKKMNISPNDHSIENQVKGASNNLKIIYKISDIGQFKELVNYEEVKKILNNVFDTLSIRFSNDPTFKLSLQQSRQIFLTRQGVEIFLMKDMKLFHFPFGYEYRLGKIHTNLLKMPNIFGGAPFDATETVQLIKFNILNTTCEIETKKNVAAEILEPDIVAYLRTIAKENNKIMDYNLKKEDLEFSETSHHDTDYSKGVVKKGFITRRIKIGNQNLILTRHQIELIE